MHDKIDEVIYPDGTSCLQFLFDNTNHDMATIDAKNTHHRLGSVAIAIGSFADTSVTRQRVPPDKKKASCKVNFDEGIQMIQYIAPNVQSLSRTGKIKNCVKFSLTLCSD